ncbi:MAG: hypothetical protein OFPII_40870 [Osedax symbiont Rs1]|nr:MAG: hypothetical protein OFPII_40870 [Osedax symbiont Rs1]
MNQPLAPLEKIQFSTVVVIGYVWPEPNSSAAGSRMLQLLEFFKHCSRQVIFASPALLGEHRVNLADYDIQEQSIRLNCTSFDDWINSIQPELVLFDRFMMEEQFAWRVEQQCPQCIRVLDTEDLHSLREARHKQLKSAIAQGHENDAEFNRPAKLYSNMSSLDICQREMAAIYRCDLSLMISDFEIKLLQEQFKIPAALLLHLPFMLSAVASEHSINPFAKRQHFVTIGNFRHAPNWDSTLWLKQSIWPKVRALMPSAQLHIYGAYPAKKVTDLHNPKQGFYVQGWAKDAIQVLRDARVCLSPLRFGAGIKGKFSDAMLAATPSITTDVGAEAMTGAHPWPGCIANSSEELAAQAVALYHSEARWTTAANQGAIILKDCYDKQTLQERLSDALSHLKTHLTQLRTANFTGTMLRHHHHQSTKYMAQWIAAKNQR